AFVVDESCDVREFDFVADLMLITAHHPFVANLPFGDVLGAVLNAGIVGGITAKRQSQFKIFRAAALPDDEGVSVSGVFSSRFAVNDAIFHTPQSRIAVPTGQVFPIEQRLHSRWL